jgi:hypothetical protein
VVANGLLPGRGPPGRAAAFDSPAFGFATGLASAVFSAGAALAAGFGAGFAAGLTAAAFAGASVGASGFDAALAAGFAGLFAAVFGAVFCAGASLPAPDAGNASRSLRTTGGSIVEDAERTNSPSSVNFPMMVLLSTPSSLASS